MNKLLPVILSIMLIGAVVPAYAEPGDCKDELLQLEQAIHRQTSVVIQSHAIFDIGVLNGFNTAKGLWQIGGNDCEYVNNGLPGIIQGYQDKVDLYESLGFDYRYGKGLVQGLTSALSLVS